MTKRGYIVLLVVVSFIASAAYVYSPWDGREFVNFDDQTLFASNPDVLTFDLASFFSKSYLQHYHPLTMISFAVESQLFDLDPFVVHLDNVLLHLINACLCFGLLRLLFPERLWEAAVTAVLFMIHPMHVESVAWATERKDVLSTFFFLLSLIFYVRYQQEPERRGFYVLCFCACLLSLLSKAMGVTLPLLFLLTDFLKNRRVRAADVYRMAPFFSLSLLFGLINLRAHSHLTFSSSIFVAGDWQAPVDLATSVEAAVYSTVFYLGRFLFPVRLSAFYEFGKVSLLGTDWILAGAAAFVSGLAWLKSGERNGIFFGWAFAAITVAPVIGLFTHGNGQIVADRYTYVPSIGYLFALAVALGWIARRKAAVIVPIAIAMTVALAVLAKQRVAVWSSSQTLWENVLATNPHSALALNGLGLAALERKRTDLALPYFLRTLAEEPDHLQAINNLGYIKAMQGDNAAAARFFEKARDINPDLPEVHENLGLIYMRLGRKAEARAELEAALKGGSADPSVPVYIERLKQSE